MCYQDITSEYYEQWKSFFKRCIWYTMNLFLGYQDTYHRILLGLAVGQTMILEVKNEGINIQLNTYY